MEGKTSTVNDILIHPEAGEYPLLPDDQLASMAEDIAANGLRFPIILEPDQGQLVDGRNRLAACKLAGVEPTFYTDPSLVDDDTISDYILSVNVENRSLSNGQKAMFRACNLVRQGKRKNGRWERGVIGGTSNNDWAWYRQMNQAGLVIDIATRAAQLGPEFSAWVKQPDMVKSGDTTLEAAHRSAQDFESKAAMAEMAVWMPFTKAASALEQLSIESSEALELPIVDAPLTKQHRNQLEETAKRFSAIAAGIRTYLKDNA
jgi:hypothetical protein